MMEMAGLLPEKLYSGDPGKKVLSEQEAVNLHPSPELTGHNDPNTLSVLLMDGSFNVLHMEAGQNWRDYFGPLQLLVPAWPVNPPPFRGVMNKHLKQVRELGSRLYAAIWEDPQTSTPMICISDQLQIIKNEDLLELSVLGFGTFGTVYHGKWRGTDVAIKRFKENCFLGQSSEQVFWQEAEILSMLHHPNVVAFYGVVKDGPGGTLATLTEFMVNGSLRHVLQREGKLSDPRKRLLIAMDAAFGMEYLHSKNIVHFDLKCDNLLVNLRDNARPICKVGDFGLSKIRSNTLVSGGMRGTLPWMAPELLNGGSSKVSEKVDVFSFGIVMWELQTGEVPYAKMPYGAIVGGVVNNTLRPVVPDNCEPEWRKLMEQCWSHDPTRRPAFTEIAAQLQLMSVAVAVAI